jgi:hypothetical protein
MFPLKEKSEFMRDETSIVYLSFSKTREMSDSCNDVEAVKHAC